MVYEKSVCQQLEKGIKNYRGPSVWVPVPEETSVYVVYVLDSIVKIV